MHQLSHARAFDASLLSVRLRSCSVANATAVEGGLDVDDDDMVNSGGWQCGR